MSELKKIAIIGYGFVGKAIDFGFSKNVKKIIIDPKINTSVNDLSSLNIDFIFIAVPTPMNKDGTQDDFIIKSVLEEISLLKLKATIIIKSTVLPSNLKKISTRFDNIIYNPEFLRENFAEEDFINSKGVILGGDKENIQKVKNLYLDSSNVKNLEFFETDIHTASLVKYSINSFLALKVAFFNQIFNLAKKDNDFSWNEFIEVLSHDPRIGDSHLKVPGPDGRFGFGGACFPKDTAALIKYAQDNDVDFSILEAAVKFNNKIRKSYKINEERELEQKVNFDFLND